MRSVDLNSDLGESFGRYTVGNDEAIISMISSANIACGFHASDPVTMKKTVELAKKYGVSVGAHPGFKDLVGFGRRKMELTANEIYSLMIYQIGALQSFCSSLNLKMSHIKPHGALYNSAVKDEKTAKAVVYAVRDCAPESGILAPYNSQMINIAEQCGIKYACEVFADRAYESDGTLVPRTKEGSMITDEEKAVERVLEMIENNRVASVGGEKIYIKADSVCVHGDGERALMFVQKIRKVFAENNIQVKSCW